MMIALVPQTSSSSSLSNAISSSSYSSLFHYSSQLRIPISTTTARRRSRIKRSSSYSICTSSWQELAGVLIFSAIPFTAVKVIANSSLGATLQKKMLQTKATAVQNSSNFKASAEKARNQSFLPTAFTANLISTYIQMEPPFVPTPL